MCALKLTTLSPKGRASRALDDADTPTSPAGWSLVKSAMHGACWEFAAPDADGAVTARPVMTRANSFFTFYLHRSPRCRGLTCRRDSDRAR
jgi:hypothetical protein